MNLTKFKAYFGFAVKGNKIVFGADAVYDRKPIAVFVSDALSENSLRKLTNLCNAYDLSLTSLSKEDMDKITLNEKIMAFGISDRNLAEAMINCME
ncbi:MAG: hypothetical protein IJS74_00335 [Clostridia bacterium]|nr:hypothetical protein [Clostridia bacterium]